MSEPATPLLPLSERPRRFRRFLLLAGAIVVLDQLVKLAIKLTMTPGQDVPLLGNVFRLHFLENKGAAFGLTLQGLFGDGNETAAKAALTLISLALVGVIVLFLRRVAVFPNKLPVYVAMILGGALGNIIDRVAYGAVFAARNDYEGGWLHGRVVDMFYLDIWKGYVPEGWPLVGGNYYTLWPVFNIADVAISVGIVLVLVFQRRLFRPVAGA